MFLKHDHLEIHRRRIEIFPDLCKSFRQWNSKRSSVKPFITIVILGTKGFTKKLFYHEAKEQVWMVIKYFSKFSCIKFSFFFSFFWTLFSTVVCIIFPICVFKGHLHFLESVHPNEAKLVMSKFPITVIQNIVRIMKMISLFILPLI